MRAGPVADVRRAFGAIVAGGCIVGCQPHDAPAQVVAPSHFEVTGIFRDTRLDESSGVAVSRRLAGVLWTHNDSGDEPTLYAVDSAGTLLGTYTIAGARAVDWEDIALGPCPGTPRTCLYIADTGDNSGSRASVDIYVVEEPSVRPSTGEHLGTLPARRLRIRYADGSQDVEALAITPSGTLLLISKGRGRPIGVYHVPAGDILRDTVTVQRAQELDIVPQRGFGRQVTGAATSPDGSQVVVRTYIELAFYSLTEALNLVEGPKCLIAGRELQGEAVDFVDDSTLVLTSEAVLGRPGTISRVRCPVQ